MQILKFRATTTGIHPRLDARSLMSARGSSPRGNKQPDELRPHGWGDVKQNIAESSSSSEFAAILYALLPSASPETGILFDFPWKSLKGFFARGIGEDFILIDIVEGNEIVDLPKFRNVGFRNDRFQ